MFGGGRGGREKRGRDISIDIELSFKEAVFGVDLGGRRIIKRKSKECDGDGAKKGTDLATCGTCDGQGKVQEAKQTVFGAFSTTRACDTCYGRGKVPKEKCKKCDGAGVTRVEEEVPVAVPAGINDGEMMRLTGGGEAIPGGTAGDLYVRVHVKGDSRFTKEGYDLIMPLSIKLTDALLGSSQKIETLDGELTLKIPQGVTFGEKLRIKNKGVPKRGSSRGDLYVKIDVQIPGKLSRSAKKAAETLRDEGI